MNIVKSFKEFIDESYLEKPVNIELLKHNEKKMKKNGYIEVSVIEPVDELKKDDKVLVSATEFGQLEDDAMVTCYKDDDKFIVQKKNLQVEM